MKTMKRTIAAAFTVAIGLTLAGCRTDKAILNDYEVSLVSGNYGSTLAEVKDKADAGGGSEQMWRLLAGSACYLSDDKVGALEQFDKAERVFQRNDAKSVFEQGGEGAMAMMTNDRAFDYDGGGLDRVFTCVYRGIDFMSSGRVNDARVELNRANQYQSNWLNDRRRDIEAAEKKMAADAAAYEREHNSSSVDRNASVSRAMSDASFCSRIQARTGFDPVKSGNLATLSRADYLNAYASHLTGVFRWIAGDTDRGELKEAAAVSAGNAVAARDGAERAAGVRPRNQVWIYVEDGLCPCREEWRLDLPIIFIPYAGRYVQYAGMALPYLRTRAAAANAWQVTAGGAAASLATLADVDRLVKVEYDVYMRGALPREITRTVVRVGAQIALGVVADGIRDDNTRMALQLAQLGVAAWSVSTTAADLRSWTALPKRVLMCRVDRPADGKVRLLGDGHPQVEVTLPEGNSLVFVRKTSAAVSPVVKTMTLPN